MSSDNPIRQSFNRAATSYAATARLQRQVAEQLVRELHAELPSDFAGTLLDAGCGTGYCLTQLAAYYPAATVLGLDFASAMLQTLPPEAAHCRINGDLQHLPLANSSIDLYVSSLAWQWCHLNQAIAEAARVLKPGAPLWLATLVAGTFHELQDTLYDAGLIPAAHLLAPTEKTQVLDAFQQSPLHVITARCDTLTTFHPDFATLRRSIRGVGANRLPASAQEPISRVARQRLIEAYEVRRTSHGLPLSYHVLTIHAQRI